MCSCSRRTGTPRFHIGESLLPLNLPLFERLGVADEVARIGMSKFGAEFVSPWHSEPVTFEFAHAVDKVFPYAYQVRRSEFDLILFRPAAHFPGDLLRQKRLAVEADGGCLVQAPACRPVGVGHYAAPLNTMKYTTASGSAVAIAPQKFHQRDRRQ
jgi:hypothetical protein